MNTVKYTINDTVICRAQKYERWIKMEKMLKRIQPKHYGIVAAVLAGLGMYIILSVCNYLSAGKYIILDSDYLQQYIPYIKMFIRDLFNGESVWFSWNTSMGMNTSLINAYYVYSPFNLLYLVFWTVDENIITAAIIILKISLCAYMFQLFLKRVMKCAGVESIFFSIMYALSSYVVIYGYLLNSWLEGAYMLPLICVLIYELNDSKSYLKLILAYAYIFITQFYFAYIVGVFSFLFWVLLLFLREKNTINTIIRKVIYYFGSVILAVGISAIVILPTAYFLIYNSAEDATSFSQIATQFYDLFFVSFWGNVIIMDNKVPAIYCGLLVMILLPWYFLNKEIEKKEKILYGILIIFLFLTMLLNPLFQFMHAFDAPDCFNFRQAFLLVFLLCAVACKQFTYYDKFNIKYMSILVFVYIVVYAILQKVDMTDPYNKDMRLIVNVILLGGWLGIWFLHKKKNNNMLTVVLVVLILLAEMCGNGWYVIRASDCIRDESFATWRTEITNATEEVAQDEGFYRCNYDASLVVNSDSWFGYNGLGDFSSAENYNLRQTMKYLGLATTTRKTDNFGVTQPVETILGVKYHVNLPSPHYIYESDRNYTITENPYHLQIGYMVEEDVIDYSFPYYDSFGNINSLLSTMSGVDAECFVPYGNSVMVKREQAEIEHTDEYILISYDPETYDYGKITYFIPKEDVVLPVYMQFVNEVSMSYRESPYIVLGTENIARQKGYLTVPYIKPMVEEEDQYTVSIVMTSDTTSSYYYRAAVFYEYHERALQQIYNELSQAQLEVVEYADGYVKGNINVSEDKTLLFTSIPYDENWKVWVDGKEAETLAVIENTFLAVQLEPGYHDVEFEFVVPGVKLGLMISGLSIGIFAVLVAICAKKSMKKV